MKTCTKCNKDQPIESFDKNKLGRDGRRSTCRVCQKAAQRGWYLRNSAKRKEKDSVWAKANRGKKNASKARYRAAMLKATPPWAGIGAIKDVYMEADYMQLEVDHIIPLQGKLVSGLHVWDNLQLLTKSDNCKKSNRYAA